MAMPENQTVLIVEDEPLIRRALLTLLQHRGFRTLSAETGAECLRIARARRPDVILLNIQLPDTDGWRIHDELLREPDPVTAPVIAITGFPAAISRLAALENGFAAFLEKPFRYSELLCVLQSVMRADGRAARSESAD
jgi:diguanylate cyclase